MTNEQRELWERIERFELDDPTAVVPFSRKLAGEQGRSPSYTDRAVVEYKRFLLLAMTAGHVACPSEAVDQVWHAHLLYTRSYWGDLCGRVLRRPLHHEPSRGGVEKSQYESLYARTLETYERVFGQPAPVDIWPSPHQRERRRRGWRRVDLEANWVVPRRLGASVAGMAVVGVVLVALAAGCAPTRAGGGVPVVAQANPFDWRGPEFLSLYLWALAAATVAVAVMRWMARGPSDTPVSDYRLDTYETSYLNGGEVLAVNNAVVRLIDRGMIRVIPGTPLLERLPATSVPKLHPLEQAVWRGVGTETKVKEVRSAAAHEVARIAEKLGEYMLVVPTATATGARWSGAITLVGLAGVGVVKVVIGASRGRPIGYLVTLVIVTVVLGLFWGARRLHRTRRGSAVLRSMQSKHVRLKSLGRGETGDVLTMGVALYGMDALATHEMSNVRQTLQPPLDATGIASGCGGGGCGGGGGDGGGCGGCGGGD